MKSISIAIFFIISTAACAQVHTEIFQDGKTSVHDVNFDGCHFKMTDPFDGSVRLGGRGKPVVGIYRGPLYQAKSEPNDFGMQFLCKPADKVDKKLCGLELENGKIITSGLEGFTEDEKLEVKKNLNQKLIILNGKNWKGAGVQEDQISGDEELRTRSFNFCMPFGDHIVKGRVESAAQLENLKESAMPNIIKLLEGIEFIDNTATTAPATNAP